MSSISGLWVRNTGDTLDVLVQVDGVWLLAHRGAKDEVCSRMYERLDKLGTLLSMPYEPDPRVVAAQQAQMKQNPVVEAYVQDAVKRALESREAPPEQPVEGEEVPT